MNLLILGGKASGYSEGNPSYRGTYRAHPYYCDQFPESHEVNQVFLWFIEEGGELGVVHDMEKARNLVELYRKCTGEQFEVVEVTTERDPPFVGTDFLGFDLSCGFNNSLLWWGLDLQRQGHQMKDNERVLNPLLRLVEEFFRPKLNSNGLFADCDTAAFCLECMTALQKIRPGLFEGNGEYEVVGVYKL